MTAVADETGTVQERYEYDPYGETTVLAPDFTVRTASNYEWETTYCGYRWDLASNLFAIRYRYYHCQLGAWITQDPIDWIAGPNFYGYVNSSPIDYFDPFGLVESQTILEKNFGGDYVRIDVEPGSNPPIHAHCTPKGGEPVRVYWRGTRFDRINPAMFKRLMSNPVARARIRAAIAQAKKIAQSRGARSGCIAFVVVFSAYSVAEAGVRGGPKAAAKEGANVAAQAAKGVALAGAAGVGTHVGLTAAGVTVTGAGGTAVLGAGATLTGGSALAVGGGITLTAGVGYGIGTGIANTRVGGNTVAGHLGNAMYSICNWCFNW